jgi:hypothetical protein
MIDRMTTEKKMVCKCTDCRRSRQPKHKRPLIIRVKIPETPGSSYGFPCRHLDEIITGEKRNGQTKR